MFDDLNVPGTIKTRTPIYNDTIDLFSLFVDHQILQQYFHSLPFDG